MNRTTWPVLYVKKNLIRIALFIFILGSVLPTNAAENPLPFHFSITVPQRVTADQEFSLDIKALNDDGTIHSVDMKVNLVFYSRATGETQKIIRINNGKFEEKLSISNLGSNMIFVKREKGGETKPLASAAVWVMMKPPENSTVAQ